MTIINNSLRDSAATSHFIDAQEANSYVRGFGGLDSIAHAMIDQADIASDGKTLYGVDIRDVVAELLGMVPEAQTMVTTAPDVQTGDTGSKKSPDEIYIPTGGEQLA